MAMPYRPLLTVEEHGGALALIGELDISTVDRLEQALAQAERDVPPEVVLDLRGLEFMDSSGLRTILQAHKRAEAARRDLVVICDPGAVRRTLEISGAVDVLTMRD